MKKLKLLFAAFALLLGVSNASAETDYTSLMSSDWSGSSGNFGGGKERYQNSNYTADQKVMYQSFTAPATGIYEIKFYAVTSSTSGRGFDNKWGPNIAQAYASVGESKATVAMEVINQTGCTLVADANIRTLSIEATEGQTIEYGLENIGLGGNWYTIKELSAKMKTVAEIFQAQYDEAYAIWENSTENEVGAKATFKTYVDALNTAMTGTLAEAQEASDNLAAQLVIYESKSYPVKGSGVKYDFTSKMDMAINAWTCKQGNGPAQYGFTGATETYGNTNAGDVMYQTISGLANGEYEIHFYAVANAANGGGVEGTKTIVYANDQESEIDVITQSSCTPSDYERTFTVMVTDGSITYGFKNTVAAGNWYICKNVAFYMTGAPDLSDYYDAIAANLDIANGLTGQKMGPAASSNLATAIAGANGYESITVIGTLETINQNLIDANNAASASVAGYVNLGAAIIAAGNNYTPLAINASAYNGAITAAQNVYDNASVDDCTATINSLTTAMQTANVADYTYVTENYPYAVNLGTWITDNATERSSQHWDGTPTSTYNEQNEGWGSNSWTCSYSQDLTLPAGNYVFKVAGRKSGESAELTLKVTNGNEVIGMVNTFPNGDTGKGIETSGAANFGDGTFAKNPNHAGDDLEGCGWQWRFVEFTLANPATVNVAVTASASAQYQWVGFCNATVQTDDADNVALMEALVALNNAKIAATEEKLTDNVGSGVFQISESVNNSLWGEYTTAKNNAENYELTAESTVMEVENLIAALSDTKYNYSQFKADPLLNAPDAEKRYVLTLDGKGALTFKTAETEGGYGMPFMTANVNLAQAFMFEAVSNKVYKMYFYDLDGNKRYICTRADYGEGGTGTYGIRTSTDKSLDILISAVGEGVFNMLNTACENNKLGSNGGDFYTDDTYSNWTIAEAEQATVDLNIAADVQYATRIFPFAPTSWPENVVAYTCNGADKYDELELVPAGAVEANVPYILYAEEGSDASVSGWGTAAATSYTDGWLTGVYVNTEAVQGTYVLQNHGGNVAFYVVGESVQPTVGANRCYLTPSVSGREAFFFGGITGVENVEAASEATLKDGKYLENGQVVIVKKGIKFNAAGAQVK